LRVAPPGTGCASTPAGTTPDPRNLAPFDYKPGELLLTGVEAAEILGVTPHTLAEWARTDKLYALRLGGDGATQLAHGASWPPSLTGAFAAPGPRLGERSMGASVGESCITPA
jgi:hypothetical protein